MKCFMTERHKLYIIVAVEFRHLFGLQYFHFVLAISALWEVVWFAPEAAPIVVGDVAGVHHHLTGLCGRAGPVAERLKGLR